MRRGPTLVHCEHGADRTGLVTALYRIAYQGWNKNAAIDELENGNFGFHDVWINIPAYIRNIDVPALRKKVGLI
jgi:protein tyrosine/serine phosphatase